MKLFATIPMLQDLMVLKLAKKITRETPTRFGYSDVGLYVVGYARGEHDYKATVWGLRVLQEQYEAERKRVSSLKE